MKDTSVLRPGQKAVETRPSGYGTQATEAIMSRRIEAWIVVCCLAGCALPPEAREETAVLEQPAPLPRPTDRWGRPLPEFKLQRDLEGPRAIEPAHAQLAALPGPTARAIETARPALDPVRAQLRDARLVRFQAKNEESLRALVDRVQVTTGLPLVVTEAAENLCYDGGVVFNLDLSSPIGARDLLNLIDDQAGDEVTWTVAHGAILFTAKEKLAASSRVMRLYDIRTLTTPRTSFSGPRIDRIRLLDELEDDDGGGPFGGPIESVEQTTPEEVMELIQANVAHDTWENDGVSIDHTEGLLIVIHSLEVQAQVRQFLQQLGAF